MVMILVYGYDTGLWLCHSFPVSHDRGVRRNRRKNGPAIAAKGAKRVSRE